MKNVLLVLVAFFMWSIAYSQNAPAFANVTMVDNQVVHGDGIDRFLVQSDNLLRNGRIEEAILVLDAALAQNPFFAEIYIKRATQLFKLGRQSEAVKDLETANRLNPYATQFLTSSGDMEKLQWLAFSAEDYQDLSPGGSEEQDVLNQILSNKTSGSLGKALLQLDSLILEWTHPRLYNLKANILLVMEDYDAAIRYYTKAIQESPETGYFYFNRAVAKLFLQQRSPACEDLENSSRYGYTLSADKLKYFCYY